MFIGTRCCMDLGSGMSATGDMLNGGFVDCDVRNGG